ncbi:MAG: glycosyltransferase family 4 protein [Methylococcaceae bacterium]
MNRQKILLFANTDWYLFNFRLSLAKKLKNEGWDVVLISPSGEFGQKLLESGFKWIPFDFSNRSTNPFSEFAVILRLIRLYRKERPHLAHHFTIKCVLYGGIAARFTHGTSVVNAVTGLGHIFTDSGIKAQLLRPVVGFLYRKTLNRKNTRVIFQNDDDRLHFTNTKLVDKSLTHLIRGSGVNCDIFNPKHLGDVADNKVVSVLFASRLLREKGIYELLAAAKILNTGEIAVEFLIAGDLYPGNPSSLTESELEDIKKLDGVTYLGHVHDMHALLAKSDIVVLPSYREGTPRILIEAAAMEKPIVCTDIAGCLGLVQEGVNGFLVPVKAIDMLAEKLRILISDSQLRRDFGRAGRQIVLSEFDEKKVLQKTFNVYQELV